MEAHLSTCPRDHPSTGTTSKARLEEPLKQLKKMGIRRVAEEYGVPKSTLSNHLKGKYTQCAKSVRRLLSDKEDVGLAAFLIGCGTVGYAKPRKEVLTIVQQILFSQGSNQQVTKAGGSLLRQGNQNLHCNSEALSYACAAANDPTTIAQYFHLLEYTIEVHGLTHHTSQIFNCDETGTNHCASLWEPIWLLHPAYGGFR